MSFGITNWSLFSTRATSTMMTLLISTMLKPKLPLETSKKLRRLVKTSAFYFPFHNLAFKCEQPDPVFGLQQSIFVHCYSSLLGMKLISINLKVLQIACTFCLLFRYFYSSSPRRLRMTTLIWAGWHAAVSQTTCELQWIFFRLFFFVFVFFGIDKFWGNIVIVFVNFF